MTRFHACAEIARQLGHRDRLRKLSDAYAAAGVFHPSTDEIAERLHHLAYRS